MISVWRLKAVVWQEREEAVGILSQFLNWIILLFDLKPWRPLLFAADFGIMPRRM